MIFLCGAATINFTFSFHAYFDYNHLEQPCITTDNIISDIVEPNIPDTIANIKQNSLHGRYFKELEQPEINIQVSHAWLKKSNIHPETGFYICNIRSCYRYKKL
jgi:hypothetical protein